MVILYHTSVKIDFTTLWPVGSYYETSDLTFDPNVSWGGTWEQDSKGRATFSYDDSKTQFNSVGKTGGSVDHKHSYDCRYTSGYGNHNGSAYTAGGTVATTKQNTDYSSSLPPYVVVVRWHRVA